MFPILKVYEDESLLKYLQIGDKKGGKTMGNKIFLSHSILPVVIYQKNGWMENEDINTESDSGIFL